VTTDGRDLGTLIDFYFDETTGAVEGYEASGGLFADAYSGRSFVPAPQALKIGEDVAFVPAETAGLMEEQVGGIKAVMQNAIEKIQETAQVAGEKFQETTAIAGLTVEQAEGRRAQRAVYTSEGYIVVAQGQIVTTKVIDRAKVNHQESALLDAVGLSTSGAAQSTANTLATNTGYQLKTTGAIASEQIQEGASQLWNKVKETASDLQGKSTQAIDEQRIKGALGRPTTRVILDLNDEVILNVGELITHKAIDCARSAGILDLLLDSVYTETPHLSIEELRAPTAGKSAL
jgi:PRC-barrel domain